MEKKLEKMDEVVIADSIRVLAKTIIELTSEVKKLKDTVSLLATMIAMS